MDNYVNVFTANNVSQAYVIKCALENDGIEARVENEFLEGGLALDGATAPRVCVPESCMAKAQGIVNRIVLSSSEEAEATPTTSKTETMVLMHVKYDDFVEDEIQELGEEAMKLCKQQTGFLSAKQFEVKDGDEFYILMHWENEHAFQACKQSPAWLMPMPQWSALQEDVDVILDIKVLHTV